MFIADDAAIAYGVGAAATAASGAYSANQANQTSAGNAYMANSTNMFMQAQNQDYNSAEAARVRGYNSSEAAIGRGFAQEQQNDQQAFNAEQSAITRGFNQEEAEKNRAWQANQSATAYQRAIADMKAAGLNPMLAYSQGPANTGGGSSASSSAASSGIAGSGNASGGQASSGGWAGAKTPDVRAIPGADLGAIMNSALDMKMKEAQIGNVNAQTRAVESGIPITQQNYKEQIYTFEDRMRQVQFETSNQNIRHRMNVELEDVRKDAEKLRNDVDKGRIGEIEARTRATNISAKLDELGVPAAENASKWAEKSGMTDSILNTVGKGVGTAAGIAGTARLLRGGRSGNYSETYYDRHGNESGGKSRDYGD